jgi:hypothetical protein
LVNPVTEQPCVPVKGVALVTVHVLITGVPVAPAYASTTYVVAMPSAVKATERECVPFNATVGKPLASPMTIVDAAEGSVPSASAAPLVVGVTVTLAVVVVAKRWYELAVTVPEVVAVIVSVPVTVNVPASLSPAVRVPGVTVATVSAVPPVPIVAVPDANVAPTAGGIPTYE